MQTHCSKKSFQGGRHANSSNASAAFVDLPAMRNDAPSVSNHVVAHTLVKSIWKPLPQQSPSFRVLEGVSISVVVHRRRPDCSHIALDSAYVPPPAPVLKHSSPFKEQHCTPPATVAFMRPVSCV